MFRINEGNLETLIVEMLNQLSWDDPDTVETFKDVLRASIGDANKFNRRKVVELQKKYNKSEDNKTRLLDLLIDNKIEQEDYDEALVRHKQEKAKIKLEMDTLEREGDADADLVVKTIELLQDLPQLFVMADSRVKRNLLEVLLLNCYFDGITLSSVWNKPFDVIAKGLVLNYGDPTFSEMETFCQRATVNPHFTANIRDCGLNKLANMAVLAQPSC